MRGLCATSEIIIPYPCFAGMGHPRLPFAQTKTIIILPGEVADKDFALYNPCHWSGGGELEVGTGIRPAVRSALEASSARSYDATYRDGQVRLDETVEWPEGLKLVVTPVQSPRDGRPINGHVVIVGFGLAGRCVADLLDGTGMSYTIIERNPETVETQRALGRRVVAGDASDEQTLSEAGLDRASILALTIPDEDAVLEAITLARRLRPEIYIIARTNYSSKGMQASHLGANDVVMAEQAVALEFYDRLSRRL